MKKDVDLKQELKDLSILSEDDQRDAIASDFMLYAKYMLGSTFQFRKYHYLICSEINKSIKAMLEKKRTRKGFFIPPRHGKTLFYVDLLFPYFLGRFPEKKCLCSTYNEGLAKLRKKEITKLIDSEEYRWLFPEVKVFKRKGGKFEEEGDSEKGISTALEIKSANSTYGYLHFAGRENTITGLGYDLITIDDPYKNDTEARSQKINENIKNWFRNTIQTRLEVGAMLNLIYTRWVSRDIVGMLEEEQASNTDVHYVPLEIFTLPAEKIGVKTWYDDREEGEPLDELRLPDYASAKKNPETWAALFQQQPLDVFGALIKLDWFKRHWSNEGMQYITIVVDTNYREKTTGVDKTCVSVFGTKFGRRHLIEFGMKKMDFPEQLAVVKYFANKHPYWAILIETKANGDAILSSMRKFGFSRCVPVDPQGKGKRERAQLVLPFLESGYMSLPDVSICPNIGEAIDQILRFTGVGDEEDDFIDTLIYDIAYYEQHANIPQGNIVQVVKDPLVMGNNSMFKGMRNVSPQLVGISSGRR